MSPHPPRTRPRVLVLQHQDDASIDLLGVHLEAAGLDLDVVDLGAGQELPARPDHDALVVLGGEMNVWETDAHPWLATEKDLLRRWTDDDRGPLLGICLGHQLLADALGADVGPMDAPEMGLARITATPGPPDTLLGPLGPSWPALQWHGVEVRTPPAGADVVATGERSAVQAMRIGSRWWGVQFHPEVGAPLAAEWGDHPVFRRLLGDQDGPEGPDRFAAALPGAAGALGDVTAALAAGLARLVLEGDPPAQASPTAGPVAAPPSVGPVDAPSSAAGSASSTARSRS